MPILESIAAASAAYEVIKTAINQGREGAGLIGAVGKFLSAEEDIKEAVQRKKNSPLTAITGGEEGDWEEFQALEKLREQRKELENYIRETRPGQWGRWQQWQVEARKQRAAARRAAEKAREERNEMIALGAAILLAVSGSVAGIYWLGVYLEKW